VLPRLLPLLLVAALTTACMSVYRPEVQQGNAVTPEMLEKLKLGMTRSQVRFVLGTPLIQDPFHPDRWDYFFYRKQSDQKKAEEHRVTVYFDKDALVRVEGDIVPSTMLSPAVNPEPPADAGGPASHMETPATISPSTPASAP